MQSEQALRWGCMHGTAVHIDHTHVYISDKEEFAGLIRKKLSVHAFIFIYLITYILCWVGN